ncbi:MAG: molybdate ABC transporter substrate-binding protein [Pseudomonadota bacterium]
MTVLHSLKHSPKIRAVVLGLALTLFSAASQAQIIVFAAASMADAISEAARTYSEATDQEIMVAAAASSTLARQIEHGSGVDIFISASSDWIEYLDNRRLIDRYGTDTLAYNQLVLIAAEPLGYLGTIGGDLTLEAILPYLGVDQRFALGDPTHVPAGKYAKQVLDTVYWWSAIEPYIAPTGTVRAALAMVDTGNAPLGMVYATDAMISPNVHIIADVDPQVHPAILYPIALLPEAQPAAQGFYRFLLSAQGADILSRYGFIPARDQGVHRHG